MKRIVESGQQDLAEDYKTRVKYEIGDPCDLNTLKSIGEFDLIYSTFTLHHLANAELAIKNLYYEHPNNRRRTTCR